MIVCCRCGRRILKSAVPANVSAEGPAAYGLICAMRLGLLPEPSLFQRKRRTPKRRPGHSQDDRQMRIPA